MSDLFTHYEDWLGHTLAHADTGCGPAESTLDDGTLVMVPGTGMLRVTPPRSRPDAPRLIVSSGVHGNETAPVEMLNRLVTELLAQRWSPALDTLLILGNPGALVAGTRFIDHNLNRLFAGAHREPPVRDTPEAARAAELEACCYDFARSGAGTLLHYDLHTAIRPSKREKFALYPHVPGREVPASQMRFLLESDVDTLLLQHREGTTFASFSSLELGAESFTIELGQVRPFGHNDPGRLAGIEQALQRLMRDLAPPVLPPERAMAVFEVVHEVINTGPTFRFHIPDDVPNFTEYAPGTLIWEDDRRQYRVGPAPEAVVFPNPQVPVGQRVALMVSAGSRR